VGLNLGESLATGDPLAVDFDKSRRVLICGKTGSGKSYTLGVLVEELSKNQEVIILIVDPQGIFWTMAQPNTPQEMELLKWDELPRGLKVNLLVPGQPEDRYGSPEIVARLEEHALT